jgi:hypothetical protein
MKKIIVAILSVILFANFVFTHAIANTPTYTVIIDTQAGSVTTTEVDSGAIIAKPVIPTKEGFVFDGWNVDINKPVSKDSIRITAKWLSKEKYQAQQDSILLVKIQPKIQELITPVAEKVNILLYAVIALAVLLIILLIFVIILLNKKKHFRDDVLNLLVEEDGTRMYDFTTRIAKKIYSNTSSSLSTKINEKELKIMVVNIIKQIQAQNHSVSQTPTMQPITAEQTTTQHKRQVLYADRIKDDGTFNEVTESPNNDTVFELEVEKPDSAKFTVYKSVYNKIICNPEFLKGCDIQKNGNTRMEIIFGKAQEQSGKWLVKTKANIKIS